MMTISKIVLYRFIINLSTPFTTSLGSTTKKEEIIVKIEDEAGTVGWGEASPSTTILSATPQTIIAALDLLAPMLIDEDPRRIGWITHQMDRYLSGNPPAKAALDIALHDLAGNLYGEPVWRLLGGYETERIDTDYTVSMAPLNEMIEEAKRRVSQGFRTLKIKVGTDSKEDVKVVRGIREAVGDTVGIRIDANQGWTRQQAIWALNRMTDLDIQFIEQPVRAADIIGLRAVRQAVSIPVMADEAVFTPKDAIRVIREDAADYINIKLMKSGGLYKACQIADIAKAADIPCMVGGMVETNLSATAAVHFALAQANTVIFRDLDMGLLAEERLVKRGGTTIENGYHYPSEGSGLGIEELDLAGLADPIVVYTQKGKGRWERAQAAV
jgi:o-succinylbenzoate synthase